MQTMKLVNVTMNLETHRPYSANFCVT